MRGGRRRVKETKGGGRGRGGLAECMGGVGGARELQGVTLDAPQFVNTTFI